MVLQQVYLIYIIINICKNKNQILKIVDFHRVKLRKSLNYLWKKNRCLRTSDK